MTPFTVTRLSNTKEGGQLIDETMLGIVNQVTTLTFTYTKTDPVTFQQTIETGLVTKALVLWDNDRVPRLEVLEELVWLELLDGSSEEEEEEEEEEEDEEDEEFEDDLNFEESTANEVSI